LIFHAAGRYGVSATGCTLSAEQHKFVGEAIAERGLSGRVAVELADYRDLSGTFDKIASVGMFEHVGRRRLGTYFRKIHALLAAGGRFVNTGITRPQPAKDDRQSGFVADRVFPGGELAHLSAVVREAENAGFEILRIEQRREHYGRTCRAWVANLQRNEREAIALVGRETYRTWLLYLAGSAWNFAAGHLGTEQVLMGRR
jgi:cyclopropane-fatty-acyl-phospholipid synthase